MAKKNRFIESKFKKHQIVVIKTHDNKKAMVKGLCVKHDSETNEPFNCYRLVILKNGKKLDIPEKDLKAV